MKIVSTLLFCLTITIFSFADEVIKKDLEPYKKLIITGQMTAEITEGEEFKVTAFVDGEDLEADKLKFEYDDEELTISYDGKLLKELEIHLELEAPRLSNLEAANRAEIKMKNPIGDDYEALIFNSRSGGKILAKFNHVPWVKAEIKRGGSIRMIGSTALLEMDITTGGSIGAVRTDADRVNASISMGGEIICKAEKALHAKIRGGGSIHYKGDPEILEEDIKLGGKLKKL